MRNIFEASALALGFTSMAWIIAQLVGWHPLGVFAGLAFLAAITVLSQDPRAMPLSAVVAGGFLAFSGDGLAVIAGAYLVLVSVVSPMAERAPHAFKSRKEWGFYYLCLIALGAASAYLSWQRSLIWIAAVAFAACVTAINLWFWPLYEDIKNDPKYQD